MKDPGDDKRKGVPPLIEELTPRPRKAHRPVPKRSSPSTGERPSLLDDVFTDRASRSSRQESKRHVEQPSDRGPSLLNDVFAPEDRLRRRIPIWAVVGVLVVVFASALVIYRFSAGPVTSPLESAVEAMTKPPSPMADSPPAGSPEESTGIEGESGAGLPVAGTEGESATDSASSTASASPALSSGTPTKSPALTRTPARGPDTPAAAKPLGTDGQRADKPVLLRGPEEPDDALQQKAFEVLRERSLTARQLLLGNLDQLRMIEWQATSSDKGQFFIDVIAETRETGQSAHFIWAVDPEKQTVRAMSQAARDLEAGQARNTR